MPTGSAVLCALLLAAPAHAARERHVLSDVEVFGSGKLSGEAFRDAHAETIRHMLNRWGAASRTAKAQAEEMRRSLEAKARAAGRFAYARLEVVELGRGDDGAVKALLMIDVVEDQDRERRLPFRPEPKADVKDVSGLTAKWSRYEEMGRRDALASGSDLKRTVCPAFYCPEGAGSPEMNALEREFAEQVPAYKQLLLQILREDKDGDERADALYLLTYLRDAGDVTALVSQGLTDPDPRVREAAVTIFNDLAIHRKDVPIPVAEVARMLDYPVPSDRQRALALLLSVYDNPDYRSVLLGPAAEQILRLLRTKHPGVRQMAHTLLTVLSGEVYPDSDYEAWDKWLWRARQTQIRKAQ